MSCNDETDLWACTGKRCQRWRKCVGGPPGVSSHGSRPPPRGCRLEATCRGSPSHRRVQNTSVKKQDKDKTQRIIGCKDVTMSHKRSHVDCSYIDHPGSVALLEVKQHGRFVEMSQQGQVLDLVKFRRVHGPDVVQVHCDHLHHGFKGPVMSRNRQRHCNSSKITHLSIFRLHSDVRTVLTFDFSLHVLLFGVRHKDGCLGGQTACFELRSSPVRVFWGMLPPPQIFASQHHSFCPAAAKECGENLINR